ncbi:hypothetical protein GCM10011391_38220 [Pullulanibacillus camelliae]|uniref:Uncharacterized protein n=1 Tax=Pullulanibacillus camelliae TaxID=1707096 RepID=A0A8J2YNN4_9BACL|nr:hypothetical protein GCM10011391_38220 [Pullulanibacillus camelliae]
MLFISVLFNFTQERAQDFREGAILSTLLCLVYGKQMNVYEQQKKRIKHNRMRLISERVERVKGTLQLLAG